MIFVPAPSRRGITLMALSGLNAVALLAVSLWLITRASEQPPIMYLQMAIVGVRAFALGRAFFRYVGRLQSHEAALTALADVRVSFFNKLVAQGPRKLIVRERGALMSTIVRDVDSLQDHALRFVEPLWVSALVIVTTILAVSSISLQSGLVLAIACGSTISLLFIIDTVTARHAARSLAPLRAEMHAVVTERIRYDAVIRAFDATAHVSERLESIENRLAQLSARPAWATASATALSTALMGVAALIILSTIRIQGVSLSQSVPPIVTTVSLVALGLAEFLVVVPAMLDARRSTLVARERLTDISSGEHERTTTAQVLTDTVSSIRVSDVAVTYANSKSPAFRPVSFHAVKGDVVVVRGQSGAGKSTLAAVLAGLLTVTQGSYSLNDSDSRDIAPVDIRRNVGLCEQQPHIFAETIRHNLDFANPDSDDEALWDVLKRVGLDQWASSREGLDTFLGEAGNQLSGGQGQRLSLARVLLAGRDVIVLDEPTANLEPELAASLLRDILDATAGKIVVIFSHTFVPEVRKTINITLD